MRGCAFFRIPGAAPWCGTVCGSRAQWPAWSRRGPAGKVTGRVLAWHDWHATGQPASAARLGWYPRDLLRQRAILRPTLGAIDAGERRLGDRGAGGARSEYEAFAERVGGEPVGSVQTGAGALADGVQARDIRAAVQIGGDSTHHVVGRRRDGHQLTYGGHARDRK